MRLYASIMRTEKPYLDVDISDYAEIGSLQRWLSLIPDVEVDRKAGRPGAGEQGSLDVLTVIGGSSALVAAFRMIPEFLRSRRSNLSITTTVKGEKVTLTASNVDEVMPILERLLGE